MFFARLWHQPQVLSRRASAVRPPRSLRFQKRDARPISQVNGVSPIALIGGVARFHHPDSPSLGGYRHSFRNNVFPLRIPPYGAIGETPFTWLIGRASLFW